MNAGRWQARAARYLGLYLLLAAGLTGLRYATMDLYPEVRALRAERELLAQEKSRLALEIQAQSSPARVRAWAERSGMQPAPYAISERGQPLRDREDAPWN